MYQSKINRFRCIKDKLDSYGSLDVWSFDEYWKVILENHLFVDNISS